jgi:hypothetical protein
MNKRGAYFFVIDAMIAASIIFLSLIIIFTTHSLSPPSESSLRTVQEYTDFLINTKIRGFQGSYTQSLINDGNITNLDNTLLEQLTEFFYLNESGKRDTMLIMNNFTNETSRGVIPAQISFAVYLNNTATNYGLLIYTKTKNKIEDSKLGMSTKKISFKRINETYIYGPIILEVRVWT